MCHSRKGFSGLSKSAKPEATLFGLSLPFGLTEESQTGTSQVSCSQQAPPP
jgi:hypothetical protein